MKKLEFIFILLLLAILGSFGILCLCSPKTLYSKEEGRTLAIKSNFNMASEKSIENLEKYYGDHFLFRNSLLEQGVNIKRKLGINIQNGVYIGKDEYLLEEPKEVQKVNEFIKIMNGFYKKYNDKNMSLVLIPSHVTVNPSKAPSNVHIFDEWHQMKTIYHQLAFNTIDVVPTLQEGLNDYAMYYRLDSHLTSYGSYYVYKEYARLNDIEQVPITEFNIKEVSNNFSGNLVKKAYTFSFKKDTIVEFIPKNNVELEVQYQDRKENTLYNKNATNDKMYEYFLGKDESIIEITNTSINNKQEILILKDESANAIIPFFTNHYYKVHVIDTNYYDKSVSGYLDTHKEIKDVVFIYKMNGLDDNIKNFSS